MSNIYRVNYFTGGEYHNRHYQALDEETAISMFLADTSIDHTDIDSDQITAIPETELGNCCGGNCGCDSQA